MIDNFTGETFPTPKGGVLTVVGHNGLKGSKKKYKLTCSICHTDEELFPDLFESPKGSLVNDQVPCGCSKSPRWSEQQVNIIVRRLCESEGYEYLGFPDGYKNNNSKFEYICHTHGKQTASYNSFVNIGSRCPSCGTESQKDKQRNPEAENIVKELCESEGYEFIGFPEGYANAYSKFEYACPVHGLQTASYHNFVNHGSRCPYCSGYGYQKSKTGIFYIVKWTNSKNESWFKFGITGQSHPETRMKQQVYIHKRKMNEELKYSIRFMCHWADGEIAANIERDFKSLQSTYGIFCSKSMMWAGHSETISPDAVDDLQEAIKDNSWLDIDLINEVYIHIPV
ncbi:hypothetical protein [Aeromonas salmonicida]|uniref:hypothetical protein n=1 Tax=Aeromonas salmonicida TaxID=645 RepID=UPI001864D5B1|nr:hypothetical protein [Aeromonas salmonicida]